RPLRTPQPPKSRMGLYCISSTLEISDIGMVSLPNMLALIVTAFGVILVSILNVTDSNPNKIIGIESVV
ncbi:hypothetical protein, partial [Ochrobactrum soli]|uniref:hypothetical protein n=1 Tax=Ochrobactrum soli TaxID=2448455 RepID=UPI001AEF0BBA